MYKDLFIRVFSNKLLFKRIIHQIRVFPSYRNQYRYHRIINKPVILTIYGYLSLLKKYYNNLFKEKFKNSNRNSYKLNSEELKLAIKVIENSIENKLLDILKYMLEDVMKNNSIRIYDYNSFLDKASQYGTIEIIRFLKQFDSKCFKDHKDRAFSDSPLSGNLKIVKFLKGKDKCYQALGNAILSGKIEILKWFIKQNYEIKFDKYWNLAIRSNNLEMIEYLFNQIKDTSFVFTKDHFENAIQNCDFNIFEWLFSKKVNFTLEEGIHIVLRNNISKGNGISIIQLMYNHFQSQSTSSSIGNSSGISNAMTWFYNNSLKDSKKFRTILEHTVYNTNLDIADWILENTSERDISFSSLSAEELTSKLYYDSFKWIIKNRFYSSEWNIFKVLLEQNNNTHLLYWFIENRIDNNEIHTTGQSLKKAIKNNDLDLIKWIHNNTKINGIIYPNLTTLLFDKQKTKKEIGEWFIENQFDILPSNILDFLLENDQMELANGFVKKFKDNSIKGCNDLNSFITTNAMDKAIEMSDLTKIKWIHENTGVGCSSNGIYSSFKKRDLEIVEWLHTNRTERYQESFINNYEFQFLKSYIKRFIVLNYPAESLPNDVIIQVKDDHIAFKHICINHQQFIKDDTIIIASKFGELEFVKDMHNKLKDKDKQLDIDTLTNIYKLSLYYAGLNNHFNIIQFIIENITFPNTEVSARLYKPNHPMEGVCIGGNIDCFKLLNNTIYKCTSKCSDIAASNGHIELLIWMNDNLGYKCSTIGFNKAVESGHHLVVKYLMESDKTLYKPSKDSMIESSGGGHLETIKLITENGFRFREEGFDRAALGGHVDLVRYLLENGYKGTVKSKPFYASNITSIIDEYHKSNISNTDCKKRSNQDNESSKPLKRNK